MDSMRCLRWCILLLLCTVLCPPLVAPSRADMRIVCDSAIRELTLDVWGNAYVHDTYYFRNVGDEWIIWVGVQLPNAASDLLVYDHIGRIDFTVRDADAAKWVEFKSRYPVRGATYQDAYSFTVNYRLGVATFLVDFEGPVRLSIPLAPWEYMVEDSGQIRHEGNCTVDAYRVLVVLPEGAGFRQSTPEGAVSQNLFTASIQFAVHNVSAANPQDITVEYGYSPLWAAFRPGLLTVAVAVVLGLVLLYRRRQRPPAPSIPVVTGRHVEVVRLYVSVCDERLNLQTQLDSVEQAYQDRGMRRRDYNRKRRIVEERLRKLDNEYRRIRAEFRSLGPRYLELADRVEKADSEARIMQSNLARLGSQRRAGKITRAVYNKLSGGYRQNADRARAVVEAIVIELRGEL
jgi:hypothetical protein